MYMYITLSAMQTFPKHFLKCYFSDLMFLVLYSYYNNVLLFYINTSIMLVLFLYTTLEKITIQVYANKSQHNIG